MPAPLTEAAIERIRRLIISGELQPGQRLPAEAELSTQVGVSRGSLREAVRALVSAGVLDVRRGDGTYVTSLTPERLLAGLGPAVEMMQDSSVLKLIESRRVIEPAVSALAAENATDQQIREMYRHLALMRESQSLEELVQHDTDFHHAVSLAADNVVLASILRGISSVTVRARVWRGMLQANARERTIAEHTAIADAIKGRQPRVAEAAALLHVSNIESWVRDRLEHGESVEGVA